MSTTTALAAEPEADVDTPTVPRQACLLVWDNPNMWATARDILGVNAATKKVRYEYASLAAWLVSTAGCGLDTDGAFFLNVPDDEAARDRLRGLVGALRIREFGVFVRPKIGGSDIDDDLVRYVEERAGGLAHLLIATHDKELIERTVRHVAPDCRVTVIGFEEMSTYAMASPTVEFVDIEDVDGMFREPLPRVRFSRLPPEGAFLKRLGSLRSARPQRN